jgi:glycosyltransferase involved in cell wall biosynthesis
VDIAFACHRYHPVAGGSERIAQLLAEAAAREGHRVTLITQREPGVPPTEELNGVRVVRLAMHHVAGIRIPRGYLSALRATHADLFHLHGNRIWCADFYLPFARLFSWGQLGTGHGFYQYAMHPRRRDRWYFERYFPRAVERLDRYVCDTEYERDQLRGWGVRESHLARIPLGVPIDEFLSDRSIPSATRASWGFRAPHVAVYVGGFFENKRVDRLIDAVAAAGPDWALVAIGRDIPGTPYSAGPCEARARTAGIEYLAPGALPRSAIVAAIRAADVVVSGSEYEGFGVTLAEAVAAGRPFVAFRTGAAPEIAASGAGVVVDTVPEFAAALRTLTTPGELARRSLAAQAAAPEWSDDAMIRRYLSLYEVVARR